ncbi:Glycosyltransferase involved in cell wall bisynthesis [Arenibacter palladensis]|uniref:Glycosyltransferase involved in cell wall bisynthesis n=1 Tax=Arenibacter palladensis TaxID=237373 RepID=A0A1M5EKU9_9FLAO|nr:glycosyltransferase [Arenibacter palladensis]SHF79806.1 Glycosyltransferase involved in cell wall bisynthesis [Arenibacter palladensis]
MKKDIDWLIVIPTDSLGGGAEQLLFNVASYLSNKNEKCQIVFLSKKRSGMWEVLENKCKIKYLPTKNLYLGYLLFIPYLIGLRNASRIKNTFSSQTLINALLGLMKKFGILKNTKIIVRESNSIFHLLKGKKLKIYALAYKIGYSKINLVICQTNFMRTQLLEANPWMNKKLKVIVMSNPVDLDMINQKSKIELQEKYDSDVMVAAGRLVPVKGFDLLIESFFELQKLYPNLKLIILGEGKERINLQKKIDHLNLTHKVNLIGFVKNVYPYFKVAKLCVMSSRIEGFPNVLLQMMSQNTKVVSTLSAGGIDEIPGIFTCEINDAKKLAVTVQQCLIAETDNNRAVFNQYLEKRTMHSFVEKIITEVNQPKVVS